MRAIHPPSVLFVVVLALALGACPPPPPAPPPIPEFEIDHFRFYEVEPVDVEFTLRLTDQFAPMPKAAKLVRLTHFGNPSRKVHAGFETGIKRPNDHLTWYDLDQPAPEPRRTIRFVNQFGQHSIDTRKALSLLVPTWKTSHEGSEFPERLDHYKCYQVIRVNVAPGLPVVQLGDQFGSQQNVQLIGPRFFCQPALKQREGFEEKPVFDEETHFAVYRATPQDRAVEFKTQDQFGEYELKTRRTAMFAVPTIKQVFVEHDN